MTSGRKRIEELIAQLERQRARLEGVRERARKQGGPEGERLEKQAEARLRDIEQRIEALRASLGSRKRARGGEDGETPTLSAPQ